MAQALEFLVCSVPSLEEPERFVLISAERALFRKKKFELFKDATLDTVPMYSY